MRVILILRFNSLPPWNIIYIRVVYGQVIPIKIIISGMSLKEIMNYSCRGRCINE